MGARNLPAQALRHRLCQAFVRETANLRAAISEDRYGDHKTRDSSPVPKNRVCSVQILPDQKVTANFSASLHWQVTGTAQETQSALSESPRAWAHRLRP